MAIIFVVLKYWISKKQIKTTLIICFVKLDLDKKL